MVSEPTPVASFSAGEFAEVTVIFLVADAPAAVTLSVYAMVFGAVQTPSIRAVHLPVPPFPRVTVLGRAGVIVQVHAAVFGLATSWKPVGIPTTMWSLVGPVIARAR